MKISKSLFTSLFALGLMTSFHCTSGTITGDDFGTQDEKSEEEKEQEVALCVGDGDAGGVCEVSADCQAPMVCHSSGVCVGPKDPSYTCDPLEGTSCLEAGESCVNGLCVTAPGTCDTLDDCPNGYLCEAGQCTPQRDGSTCADPGPGPALAGVYNTDSILHLRDGLPGVLDGILEVSGLGRDIIQGDLDLGLPSIVEAILGGLIAQEIQNNVPAYAITLVNGLASMGDVLNTVRVEGTLTLNGQECDGNYRGTHQWNYITLELDGREMRVRPEELPGVTAVLPEEFDARYHCGDLLIGKHRIQGTLSGLVRWLLDTSAYFITGYNTVEEALSNIVDCHGVALALDSYTDYDIYNVSKAGCDAVVLVSVNKITEAIDEAALKMSVLKLRGVVPVNQNGSFEKGKWYGSLIGGDFGGSLRATKR